MRRPPLAGAALAGAVLLLAGCAAQGSGPPAEELQGTLVVFAAASLVEVFDAIAADFEAEHPGLDVVVNYGGSSALAEQIVQGAPADMFAAASEATMVPVVDAGLTGRPSAFATNTLELAVPAGNPGAVTGLPDLARPELAIALCAVEVPCGAAAASVLEAAGVTASVDTWEQDVKAVLTRVELGEVDAGLVYRTDVLSAGDRVEGIEFTGAAAAVVTYQLAGLTTGVNSRAGAAFMMYVSAEGQSVLRRAGFGAP